MRKVAICFWWFRSVECWLLPTLGPILPGSLTHSDAPSDVETHSDAPSDVEASSNDLWSIEPN